MNPKVFSQLQAAAELGIARKTLRDWERSGKIKRVAVRTGYKRGQRMYTQADIVTIRKWMNGKV
jgi:DNA-binding transcriptional MerR regulator